MFQVPLVQVVKLDPQSQPVHKPVQLVQPDIYRIQDPGPLSKSNQTGGNYGRVLANNRTILHIIQLQMEPESRLLTKKL